MSRVNAVLAWAKVALGGLKILRSRLHKEHAHYAAAAAQPETCYLCGDGASELILAGEDLLRPGAACEHPADLVVANITDADAVWGHTVRHPHPQTYNVQWCRRCGAYRTMFGDDEFGMDKPGDWNLPEFAKVST